MSGKTEIIARNKKAEFNFHIIDKWQAGLQLTGTEIKAVRQGKVSLTDSYCFFDKGELYVKNMHIAEYSHGNIHNHEPRRTRKLLLKKRELARLQNKIKERGFTIVPLSLFLNERGYAKLEIALARGKKSFDKRASIKEKDMQRELAKEMKHLRHRP